MKSLLWKQASSYEISLCYKSKQTKINPTMIELEKAGVLFWAQSCSKELKFTLMRAFCESLFAKHS